MRGQDDLTLSHRCLRLVAGQKMKSNHGHVLREGLGVALLETLMPCLHYYSTLAGLFAVLSGDGSSSIDLLTVRGYKEAGGHWRSLMGSYWVMAPWLGEIVRGYSYEDIIVDFQSLRKRRLDF
jgi:hypothetical protein